MGLGAILQGGDIRPGAHVPCPFCGEVVRGPACGRCHAPAEIVHSICRRTATPRVVGILGPSGVGKTVYLGMLLDMLAHGAAGLHGMARGSFSLSMQRQVMLALERQRFPEKTPVEADRWQWVHCEVSTGKRGGDFDLVTPDVAGEAVTAELERPGTNPTVGTLIGRCGGLVVLLDTVGVIAGGQAQEMFAMQLVSYLDALSHGRRRKVEVPVALVFTKADLCDEPIVDAEAFARAHVAALWRMCEARLRSLPLLPLQRGRLVRSRRHPGRRRVAGPPPDRAEGHHRAVRLALRVAPVNRTSAGPRMRVDQAIYTSLPRAGKEGYHVVGRSPGVSEADAAALASWSPSHGALLVDDANRVSVNFHPLTDGRLALSRTCEGPPEYSGRGGKQIYTHAIIFEAALLEQANGSPMALYRDALALGTFRYRPEPKPVLEQIEVGRCHRDPGRGFWKARACELGLPDLDGLGERLIAGERLELRHPADRLRFAECILGSLPRHVLPAITVSTSLRPSSTRSFHLAITR